MRGLLAFDPAVAPETEKASIGGSWPDRVRVFEQQASRT